ncbi:hypothetical protein [Nocardioides sp.]|uniref:hypothetical protein n=1 Tax=Nocardioides sp. TaxID=35761 RepID=UPI00356289D7
MTAVLVSPVVPAHADESVVVRGSEFPATGLADLAVTGCSGLFDRVAEPIATYVTRTDAAPRGEHVYSLDLAGGNAVGAQFAVGSVLATTVAGLSLASPGGTTGVAYVGYQAPRDTGTDFFWVGRSALSAAPGGWRPVDVVDRSYTWTRYDLATGRRAPLPDAPTPPAPQEPGPMEPSPEVEAPETGTPAEFAAGRGGDGPGFFAVGFGCDGARFSLDALRVGSPGQVTTYDLEGWTSTATIAGSTHVIEFGQGVDLAGVLRDNTGGSLDHGLLRLEQRSFGRETFQPVPNAARTVDAGDPVVRVTPTTRTHYRWSFAGTWSVNGAVSPTWVVEVTPVVRVELARADAEPEPTRAPEPEPEPEPEPGLVVTGSVAPAKPGVQVTLWQVAGPSRTAVGSAVVADDGSFRIEAPAAARLPARYVVTVPATGGNLAGTSRTVVAEAQTRSNR